MAQDKTALDHLASQLRAAVLASDHDRAARLTGEYSHAVSQHWMLLSTAERATSALPKQSTELLSWVREMTLMQQAIVAEHLAVVERKSRALTARALYLQTSALDG